MAPLELLRPKGHTNDPPSAERRRRWPRLVAASLLGSACIALLSFGILAPLLLRTAFLGEEGEGEQVVWARREAARQMTGKGGEEATRPQMTTATAAATAAAPSVCAPRRWRAAPRPHRRNVRRGD